MTDLDRALNSDDGVDLTGAVGSGLRRAVLSDLESGRDWAGERARMARSRIAGRPLEATLYALGIGVAIGLSLRR